MNDTRFERIGDHRFQPTNRLFFDTNVWIYIAGPQSNPNDEKSKVYSGALARALKAGSAIEITATVLSEFVNRVLRIEYELYKADSEYKQFRATEEYAAIAEAAAAAALGILKQCQYTELACDQAAMLRIMEQVAQDRADFNDELIAEHCHRRNLILVTHDGDFGFSGLTILTHNAKYFQSHRR